MKKGVVPYSPAKPTMSELSNEDIKLTINLTPSAVIFFPFDRSNRFRI